MADFRYGFFRYPVNKKIESHPEEKSKPSHVSDHKSNKFKPPAPVDTERRPQPIAILPGTRHVTTIETYTEEVYSRSRDESQHSNTKKYEHEPVKKNYGLHHDKGNNWHPSPALDHPKSFNKLIPKVQIEGRQSKDSKHEMSLSGPMTDIEKAIEYLKASVNHPKKDSYTKTIDSKEAARQYKNLGQSPAVHGANVATIDCKEAARKYKGATV